MPISNYAELKTAVEEWLAHDDITARVEDLISLAESSLNRRLSLRQSHTTVSGTLAGTGIITLPTDYLEMEGFRIDGAVSGGKLIYLSPSEFRNSDLNFGTGFPTHYTIVGNTIKCIKTPDSAVYTYDLDYLARIPALSVTSDENWLLTLAPDLYLYHSLLQAEPYLHNDERIQLWKLMSDNAIHELQGQDMRARYRPGVRRLPGGAVDGNFRRT